MPTNPRVRLVLRLGLLISAVWAALVMLTGGFTWRWGWLRVGSRDATRALVIAGLLLIAYVRSTGFRRFRDELSGVAAVLAAGATWIAVGISVFVFVLGVRHGTYVAGGADAYGYVSQAELWEKGNLHMALPLASSVPWPNAALTLTPWGYTPGVGGRDAVPTYPPGLPLLMALFRAVFGPRGPYFVCPLLGASATWLTFVLGRRLTGRSAVGVGAALVLATSPPFLFMLMPPMSDVPAAALWTLALVLALPGSVGCALASGVVAGAAVLVRPNLAPAGLIIFASLLVASYRSDRKGWRRFLQPAAFLAGLLPAVTMLAIFNQGLYGSALRSGYGDPRLLYSLNWLPTNASQFVQWMLESGCWYVLLGTIAAFFVWPRIVTGRSEAPIRLLLAGFVGVVWLSYLFYRPYDVWWWLRFLLPIWPVTIVLAFALLTALFERVRLPGVEVVLVLAAFVVCVGGYRTAEAKGVFALQAQESRCLESAEWVRRHTGESAVFLTSEHSGMLRHYTGRLTIRFDFIDPAWLDRAVGILVQRGYHPYLFIDPYEEAGFRRRFADSETVRELKLLPDAEVSKVCIWDLNPRAIAR